MPQLLRNLGMLEAIGLSIYPVPAYPGNLWLYLVIAYLLLGAALLLLRPQLGRPIAQA